jgi:hypothetical protein
MSLRLLLGVIGLVAILAGALICATELRVLALGSPPVPTALAALVSAAAVWGGVLLVRGAIRGQIAVRRQGRRERA